MLWGFFGLFLLQKISDRLMRRFLQVVPVENVHTLLTSFLRRLQRGFVFFSEYIYQQLKTTFTLFATPFMPFD